MYQVTKGLSSQVTKEEEFSMYSVGKRIGLTPDQDTKQKLARLSISCGMQPTTMANHLVQLCLNNPNIIEFVQGQYNKDKRYRVTPRIVGNQCIYE